MQTIFRKEARVPVAWEGDLCVLGGSATGFFAAVRAARMGLRVAVVERENMFGGTATAGLVNIWHSLWDFDGREQIIAGLTDEVLESLKRKGQCLTSAGDRNTANRFNPIALVRELDILAETHGIRTFFHTLYAGAETEGNRVRAVYIQNKDGLTAIRAERFVDATGDGDLMRDLGEKRYFHDRLQPPTAGFLLRGETGADLIAWLIREHGSEVGLDDDWGWFTDVPGLPGISFRADNHVFGLDLSRADDLTAAEFEGRRRAFALETLLKKYVSPEYGIVNLCSAIGIRETAHYVTRYQANEKDLLTGARFEDAVLRGTYRVDVHHSDDNGITFKELNGEMTVAYGKGSPPVRGNWREDAGLTGEYARWYEVPFPLLIQETWQNVIPAGRMMHADDGAFGALRVMVNTNQLGEAAGVACALSLEEDIPVQELDGRRIRRALSAGGSAL